MTVREQMQAGLEDYDLKTDEELVDIITNFGCGETKFHTADVERILTEKSFFEKENIVLRKQLNLFHNQYD